MANLVRRKQVDQVEFSGFFVEVGDSEYYPLVGNPSGFLDQNAFNVSSGYLGSYINQVSGALDSRITATGANGKIYSDLVSGGLDFRIFTNGQTLSGLINSLSGYAVLASGNLNSTINTASGTLNTKITTTSGVLKTYSDTISGDRKSTRLNSSH